MPDATMERTLNRNLFKYAVQRRMFNEDGSIADVRKSVLVEVTVAGGLHAISLFSGTEFDALPSLDDTITHLPEGSIIEIWDGRILFGKRKGEGYRKLQSVGGFDHESEAS